MTASFIFKLLLFLVMIAIFISFAGGLFFLARDKGKSKRTIYSLTARVTLSISLFLLLIAARFSSFKRNMSDVFFNLLKRLFSLGVLTVNQDYLILF